MTWRHKRKKYSMLRWLSVLLLRSGRLNLQTLQHGFVHFLAFRLKKLTDAAQICIDCLLDILLAFVTESTYIRMLDGDLLKYQLMEHEKCPGHICRWSDDLVFECAQSEKSSSETQRDRCAWGCAKCINRFVVLLYVANESISHLITNPGNIPTIRWGKKWLYLVLSANNNSIMTFSESLITPALGASALSTCH